MEKQASSNNTKSSEEAATVGMFLRHSRLAQKMTIDQVAKTLCIRRIYIKAIEESNFEELPPVPYGTGFVRSYAQLLGLNVERIVQCYKEESMPHKSAEKPKISEKTISKSTAIKPKRWHIFLGLGAIALLWSAWFLLSGESYQAPQKMPDYSQEMSALPEFVPEEAFEEAQPTPEASQTSQEELATVEQKPQARVRLKLIGESWIEVRDDQKIYITGTYPEGFEYDVPEGKGKRLSVGKRLNIEVYIDGELTPVVRAGRQINIALDDFLNH